jgi:hypothetical protein
LERQFVKSDGRGSGALTVEYFAAGTAAILAIQGDPYRSASSRNELVE